MPFQDQTLPCQGCGQPFVFTAGEQEFYEKKGFRETPKRCRGCRDARKAGGGGQVQPPAPRREPPPRPRPRAPEGDVAHARPRPGGEPRAPMIDPAREEALRRSVAAPASAAELSTPTPPPDAPVLNRRGQPIDEDIGNRWHGGPRRFGAPIVDDETDDDIGNRIDLEPRAGMSRGVREELGMPSRGGPVELQCVACGVVVRLSAPPPPGRAVFCRGCQ